MSLLNGNVFVDHYLRRFVAKASNDETSSGIFKKLSLVCERPTGVIPDDDEMFIVYVFDNLTVTNKLKSKHRRSFSFITSKY